MLLYISILLILLSLILIIYNWNINKNAIYMALFFVLLAVYGLTHYLTLYGNSVFWLALFFNTISPFMLLSGPFLYFYTRGTLKGTQGLKLFDAIHFIPAIIHFIGIFPYLLTSFDYKKSIAKMIIDNFDTIKTIPLNIFFNYQFNFIFRICLLTLYVFYSIFLLWKFSKKKNFNSNILEKQFRINYRWLQLLLGLVLFLIINFLILTFYFFYYNEGQLKSNTFIINSTTGISFIFLVFGVLFFPEILYGLPNQNEFKKNSNNKIPKSIKSLKSLNKISKKNYEDPLVKLSERILVYFEKEKPYLKPNFSIAQIALKMEVPQNHVSYCITSIYKTKFSKMKTKLRVEQTKIFLRESVHSKITIDGIAQLAGFNSRSSFYIAFKEETGITPSDYLKSIIANEEFNEDEL